MVFPLDSLQDYQLIFKPEHEMLRKSIREFLEREVAPYALEFDDKDEVPRDVLRKLGEQGLWGIGIDESLGGQGGDTISAVILMEELSRVAPPSQSFVAPMTYSQYRSSYLAVMN